MSPLLIYLSFLFCYSYVYGLSEDILNQSQEKLDDLISKSSKTSLVEIAGSDFEKFISRGPRPYYSLIILTALSSGNCQPCEQLHPSIQELASIIESQRNKINRDGKLFKNNEETDVFILNADFSNNRETFQKLGLSTAPTLVMIPPARSRKEIPLNRFFKSIPTKYQYSLTQGRSAEEIGNWIVSTSKISWLQFGSKLELPKIQYIFIAVIIIPVVLWFARKYINKLRKSMLIYSIVGMLAYSFIIGGGMFSSIRNTPWMHVEGSKTGYISHMSRYQYGVETYIIGGANFAAGISVFIYIISQRLDDIQNQKGMRKYFKYFKYIPSFVPIGVMVVGWYAIMWCYNFKNNHYNMGMVGMTG